MTMKTERFEMRVDRETLEDLDTWRTDQSDLPSRAEAVRRLLGGQVRITYGEKLILRMLCSLYKHQEVDDEFDPEFVSKAIARGYYWALDWKYGLSEGPGRTPRIVLEVCDVLDMWSFIERGYAELSKKDKKWVESEAKPFGTNVVFHGFDGNESDHQAIARFLIDDMGRFHRFKGRDFNSYLPTRIDMHRRMLAGFKPMLKETISGLEPSASRIIELLKARRNHAA